MTCDDVRELAPGFVLDALEPTEMAAVRDHLASCDDAHAEIAELASALPALAASAPVVEPPSGLGARIHAAAAADLAARDPATHAVPATDPSSAVVPLPPADGRVTSASRRGPSFASWALGIAAVLVIAVLGGMTLRLQGQLSDAQAYQASVAAVLEVAEQPGALTAVLSAEGGGGPSGLAAIDAGGAATIAMQAMPATSGDQVYEAWVIVGDEAPVALGGFQVGAGGTASFEAAGLPTDPGIVLALTLEPGPGMTAPTGPVVAAGAAT